MREAWTDQRLDELREQRRERREEFVTLRSEFDGRFGATQRLILQVGGGVFATMVVGFASLIVTQL